MSDQEALNIILKYAKIALGDMAAKLPGEKYDMALVAIEIMEDITLQG
jgi:hypothetical protein